MILVHANKKLLYANEVQKNKWTPHYQTEFDGESEKNNRFAPRGLLFWTKCGS